MELATFLHQPLQFLSMRTTASETSASYATRLREKANECHSGENSRAHHIDKRQSDPHPEMDQQGLESQPISFRNITDGGYFPTDKRHETIVQRQICSKDKEL